jgi:hypothetical protein
MLNIHIGYYISKALTRTRFWSYEMMDALLIVRMNKCVGLWGIYNFPLLRDKFWYWLVRGIPLKEGVR